MENTEQSYKVRKRARMSYECLAFSFQVSVKLKSEKVTGRRGGSGKFGRRRDVPHIVRSLMLFDHTGKVRRFWMYSIQELSKIPSIFDPWI